MRKIASLTLLIGGAIELITSIVLYIIPSGRVAYWADYHFLGLSKTQWGDIHITVGTLLLAAGSIHVFYNWRPIISYFKNKSKQLTFLNNNFNIALLLSLYVVFGTLFSLPPMNFILDFGEYLTESGNKKYGEPPYGHAELSSLQMLCDRMKINLDRAMQSLESSHVRFDSEKNSIAEIARVNKKTPREIYEIIKPQVSTKDGAEIFPEFPAPGFGKKSIKSICTLYKLPEDEVLSELKKAGFEASLDESVKEIGRSNESNPMEVFELLREIAKKTNTSYKN